MTTLAWHGFVFALPAGWEVTAFRLDPKRGEFRFHERLIDRGQLTWVRMAGKPDLEGLARDIVDRQLRSAGTPEVAATVQRRGPWLIARAARGLPFQALAWVAHDQRLLHWTFPVWEGDGDGQAWLGLLDSLVAEPGDEVRWELFGAGVSLPRRFAPVEVDARPGVIRIEYADPAGVSVTARRFGLARSLLDERPLQSWLRRSLFADRARVEQIQETARGGSPAVRAAFSMIGERTFDRVAWRRWPGEAWWWHDESANRILGLEQVGPPKAPRVDLSRGR
jgi:hypothetical protein